MSFVLFAPFALHGALRKAGRDLLGVCAAHGFSLHSSPYPLGNSRIDAYRGSRDNCARFVLAVLEATRAPSPACPPWKCAWLQSIITMLA